MRFLPDPLLYTDSRHCLAQARDWKPPGDTRSLARIPVHFFWTGPFGAKQALSIKSFLATHNPAHSECWLWFDHAAAIDAAPGNPHLAPLQPQLRQQRFRLDEDARGTPFENQP